MGIVISERNEARELMKLQFMHAAGGPAPDAIKPATHALTAWDSHRQIHVASFGRERDPAARDCAESL